MSTIKVNTIQNTSGVEVYTAKAWVNFDGTGTVAIRASGNVSSITDNGTGDYTVNFTTAMIDANYATVCEGSCASLGAGTRSTTVKDGYTTTAVGLFGFYAGSPTTGQDIATVNISVFR